MRTLPSLRLPKNNLTQKELAVLRQATLTKEFKNLPVLFDLENLPETVGAKNCENWVGSIKLPVGVAGPITLKIDGETTQYYLPMATTEGALVASVSRGAKAISAAGGATILVKNMGMSRAPVFKCETGAAAALLLEYLDKEEATLRAVSEKTSRHLQYLTHQAWIRGRHLYTRFSFTTSEAMGMNMVTIATAKIAELITTKFPQVKLVALTSNACADKKDNVINGLLGRGHWAQAEVYLSDEVLQNVLKTTAAEVMEIHLAKNLVGSNLAGSLSQNAQVANVLAALYLATGQDPAHVVEGSRAFLNVSLEKGGLYLALTLPNLNLGTVGGGTYLLGQSEARELIGLGSLDTKTLAGVIAGACLAGELSLLASLSENTLASAHQALAR